MDHRQGKNFFDLTPEADRVERMRRLTAIIDTPCGMLAQGHELHLADGGIATFDTLMLPVTNAKGETPEFIYYCINLTDKPASFDRAKIVAVPLKDSYEYIDIGCGLPA